MEDQIAERYFDGRFNPPGWLLQSALNLYVSSYHWLGILLGRGSDGPALQGDTIAERSRELMAVHYDMPLPLFERMLGPSMKYSTALWETGAATLEAAQEAMLADVCRKAGLRDGDAVLDVGCGFGSLCHYILRAFPSATVVGLTLSRTQADTIRRAQEQPGHPFHSPRFRLVQEDFNTVRFAGRFDRILSLGVFEHVANLDKALEKLRGLLHDDGKLFLHYIVYRRPVHRLADRPADGSFVGRYIFPGGRVWFDEELARHPTHFKLAGQWFLNGRNYERTLRAWLERFLAGRERIAQEAGLDERRLRIWELYLRAFIAVFRTGRGRFYGNGQYLLTSRGGISAPPPRPRAAARSP